MLADDDSVTAALEDLNDECEVHDGGRTVTLAGDVPFDRKFTFDPLSTGETIRRYGEVIGRTTAAVTADEWVHTRNCEGTRGRGGMVVEVER